MNLLGVLQQSSYPLMLALMLVGGVRAAPQATPQRDLCYPQMFGSDNSSFDGRYPVADNAFDHKRYRESFRAYYQYFFCLGGPSETVNPAAEDSGGAALLRGALGAAIAGHYREGIVATRRAIERDANFGQAPFILGDLLFVCGKRQAARAAWHSAEAPDVGYPMPPDHTPFPETYARAASEMLKRH